jgi:hypothetical protein
MNQDIEKPLRIASEQKAVREAFIKAFGNVPQEAELRLRTIGSKSALFVMNDPLVPRLLLPVDWKSRRIALRNRTLLTDSPKNSTSACSVDSPMKPKRSWFADIWQREPGSASCGE